jgi:putative methionine-R-sulfoxide reductase with GAF domain
VGNDANVFTQVIHLKVLVFQSHRFAEKVRNDCRYLTAFGSTLSEVIIPVLDHSPAVIGTIDVESERANAFSDVDRELPGAVR